MTTDHSKYLRTIEEIELGRIQENNYLPFTLYQVKGIGCRYFSTNRDEIHAFAELFNFNVANIGTTDTEIPKVVCHQIKVEEILYELNRLKSQIMNMITRYFTFGQGHAHSVAGFTYDKDVVVKITAENPREKMFEYFGDKWGMEYSECPDLKFFPRGIKEI